MRAKSDYREARRGQILDHQVDDWLQARHVHAYLEEMRTAIEAIAEPEEEAAAREWFSWAQHRASELNPLQHQLVMPPVREPTAEELKPFLNGLSPYGPG